MPKMSILPFPPLACMTVRQPYIYVMPSLFRLSNFEFYLSLGAVVLTRNSRIPPLQIWVVGWTHSKRELPSWKENCVQ